MQFHSYTNKCVSPSDEYRRSTRCVQRLFVERDPFPTRSSRVQFFDQYAEQPPEVIFAGITANAAYFVAILDEHKKRREPFDFDKGQIWRHSTINIHAP